MESSETDKMLKKDANSPAVSPLIRPKMTATDNGAEMATNSEFRNRMARVGQRVRKFRIRKETTLLLITVAAVIIGVVLGLSIRAGSTDPEKPVMSRRQLVYLKFPGELFLRMLQMLILPLIVSSIISSLAQLNTQTAGRLGAFTMIYYTATTILAVIEGIILVQIIRPGRWSEGYQPADLEKEPPCLSTAADTILDLIRYKNMHRLHSVYVFVDHSRWSGVDCSIYDNMFFSV